MSNTDLIKAVNAALAGDWHTAHNIAQDLNDPTAHWLHAVLHKIEGDQWNSKYWYARSAGRHYEDYADAQEELRALLQYLEQSSK